MTVNLATAYSPNPSRPRSADILFYAPSQPDFLFAAANQVEICCQSYKRAIVLEWSLCHNLVSTPLLRGSSSSKFDNSFSVMLGDIVLPPGFYDLHVNIVLTASQSLKAMTTFGVKVDAFKPLVIVANDFESFWHTAVAEMQKVPLDLDLQPGKVYTSEEISAYNIGFAALPEDYDPAGEKYDTVETYKVSFSSHDGKKVYGWFAKPAGPGPFPSLLVLPGAGNNPRPIPLEHARHGFASLDIQVHGEPVDAPPASYARVPDDVYTTPEALYHFKIYLNAVRGVAALHHLPGVDDRLAVMGGSQGGRLSVVVAALEARVKAVIPAIAHFANIPWLRWTEEMNKAHSSGEQGASLDQVPRDARTNVESYYDIVNFAPFIKCPVLMNSGLVDPVSAPMGVFGAYAEIVSPKKIIPLPTLGHDWSPAFDRYAWGWLRNQLGPA